MRSVWGDIALQNPPVSTQEDMNMIALSANPAEQPVADPTDLATQEYLAQLRRQQAEEAELNRQLTMQQQKNMGLAEQDIASQQRALEGYKQLPLQTDLSPVASMLDAWYGTNQAKNYQPSETPQSRMDMIRQLQAGLNKARGALSENELSLLRTRLNASAMKEQAALKALNAKNMGNEAKARNIERDELKKEKQDQEMRDKVAKSEKYFAGAISFKDNVKALRDFVAQKGLPKTSAEAQQYAQLFNRAKLDAKNVEELGAITNADVALVSGLLGPEGTWDKLIAMGRGGSEGVVKALDQTLKQTDTAFARRVKSLRIANPTKAAKPVIDDFENQFKSSGAGSKLQGNTSTDQNDDVMIIAPGG